MPRILGAITPSDLENTNQEYFIFVKVEFPSIELRYTNKPGGFIGDIDGSVKEWVEYGVDYSPISQRRSDLESIVWVSFPNLDNTWDNFNYDIGILNIPCTLYEARWDTFTTPSVFKDAYIVYEGRMDDGEFSTIAKINLKPFFSWETESPYGKMGGRCTNDFKNLLDCQYSGPDDHCEKTRVACRAKNNEIHINIYDDMPQPGETIMYGGQEHGLIIRPD